MLLDLDQPTQVGLASLYCGDATSMSLALGMDVVDVTVCSPPYNLGVDYGSGSSDSRSYVDYLAWSLAWLEDTYRLTRDGGRLCLNVPLDTSDREDGCTVRRPVGSDILDMALQAGWRYGTTIIWNEGTISRRTAWGSWRRASAPYVTAPVELIYVLYKGDRWKREPDGRTSTISAEDFIAWTLGLWSFGGESAKRVGHPAPFPEELPRRLISLYSFAEDLIYDPFVGSGTTCLVANQLGRRSIGVDIEREHLKNATVRLAKALGQEVLFDSDGLPHIQAKLEAA